MSSYNPPLQNNTIFNYINFNYENNLSVSQGNYYYVRKLGSINETITGEKSFSSILRADNGLNVSNADTNLGRTIITHTTSGDCLQVKDATSDTTYFLIDETGKVGINGNTASSGNFNVFNLSSTNTTKFLLHGRTNDVNLTQSLTGSKNSMFQLIPSTATADGNNVPSSIGLINLSQTTGSSMVTLNSLIEFFNTRATKSDLNNGIYSATQNGDILGEINFLFDDSTDLRTSTCKIQCTSQANAVANNMASKLEILMNNGTSGGNPTYFTPISIFNNGIVIKDLASGLFNLASSMSSFILSGTNPQKIILWDSVPFYGGNGIISIDNSNVDIITFNTSYTGLYNLDLTLNSNLDLAGGVYDFLINLERYDNNTSTWTVIQQKTYWLEMDDNTHFDANFMVEVSTRYNKFRFVWSILTALGGFTTFGFGVSTNPLQSMVRVYKTG